MTRRRCFGWKADDVSAAYPFPYGFVVGTKAGDGDAADCFVLTARNLVSGTATDCEPVGLLEQIEDGEVDHKVLAVLPGETFELDQARAGAALSSSAASSPMSQANE